MSGQTNGVTVNAAKSTVVVFSSHKKLPPQFYIGDIRLSRSPGVKYLVSRDVSDTLTDVSPGRHTASKLLGKQLIVSTNSAPYSRPISLS